MKNIFRKKKKEDCELIDSMNSKPTEYRIFRDRSLSFLQFKYKNDWYYVLATASPIYIEMASQTPGFSISGIENVTLQKCIDYKKSPFPNILSTIHEIQITEGRFKIFTEKFSFIDDYFKWSKQVTEIIISKAMPQIELLT